MKAWLVHVEGGSIIHFDNIQRFFQREIMNHIGYKKQLTKK